LQHFFFQNIFAFARIAGGRIGDLLRYFDRLAVSPFGAPAGPVLFGFEGPLQTGLQLDLPDLQAIRTKRITYAYGYETVESGRKYRHLIDIELFPVVPVD